MDLLERQRLAQFYSRLSDEELLAIADDEDQLTDDACDILSEELDRRGLEPEDTPIKQFPTVEAQNLVVIRKFRDLPEALLAKGLLDSAGIECYLGDDNIVRMDWFISNFIGGVKLRVKQEDADSAIQILEQPVPYGFNVEGIGRFEQPACPRCQSREISFEPLNKPIAYGSAFLGVPIPMPKNKWRCHSCGLEWDGDVDAPHEAN